MKLRWFTDSYVAKTRAFQPPRYFIAFAAGSFGVWEDEGGVLSTLMCFSRKERKGRKGVGMGRGVGAGARPRTPGCRGNRFAIMMPPRCAMA